MKEADSCICASFIEDLGVVGLSGGGGGGGSGSMVITRLSLAVKMSPHTLKVKDGACWFKSCNSKRFSYRAWGRTPR